MIFSSRRLQIKNICNGLREKSLDTYSAMGPVILHKSALPFPVEVDIKMQCKWGTSPKFKYKIIFK